MDGSWGNFGPRELREERERVEGMGVRWLSGSGGREGDGTTFSGEAVGMQMAGREGGGGDRNEFQRRRWGYAGGVQDGMSRRGFPGHGRGEGVWKSQAGGGEGERW